jgi:hypothetical protein
MARLRYYVTNDPPTVLQLEQEEKWYKWCQRLEPEKETINGAPHRYCLSISSSYGTKKGK